MHQDAYFNMGKGENLKEEVKNLPMMRELEKLGLIGENISKNKCSYKFSLNIKNPYVHF